MTHHNAHPLMAQARAWIVVAMGTLLLALTGAPAWAAASTGASALLAKRTEYQSQLLANPFGESLHLVSKEAGDRIEGEAYAQASLPYAQVRKLLSSPETLCAVLTLHINIHACQAAQEGAGAVLTMSVGPKHATSPGAVYDLTYTMQVHTATTDYLNVTLTAATGPLSTHDYRIVFEATPLDDERTFVHFGYTYGDSTLAKMAIQLYLATAGRAKIGFTVVGTGPDGRPQYVQGERGSVERNVIRNYLALVAYASVSTGTAQAQRDARLRAWFALTERHAAQLHEMSLEEYLAEKTR